MKRKDQNAVPMNSKVLITVEPGDVELLVSPQTQAPGNRKQRHTSFRVLENRVQMTQLCEKASFQYLVIAGKYYQILLDGKDGWGEITFLCREFTISRAFKESEVRLAIFTGTLIGPVSEVHIVKTHGEYGIEAGVLFNTKSTGHIFRCDIPGD